jgi:Fic family protein
MYLERKTIHGKKYFYLKQSQRQDGKVQTRTIAYLGKKPLNRAELRHKISLFSRQPALPETMLLFLDRAQLEKLRQVRQSFASQRRTLDKQLLAEMFRDFKTYYIYNTTAIEGNTLTLEETNLLLNENKTPEGKDLREIYDHLNEREVFDFILKEQPELTLKTIVDLQARLLKNIDLRTGFRRHNVRVVGAEFTPTEARYVLTDMKLLLRWYQQQKKIHPLIVAAVFHEKFERVHPFYDGNGRTGRMILNLLLLRQGFPPLIIPKAARKEYYRVLSRGHQAGLTRLSPEHYREIVQFCYRQLLATYEKVFSRWGAVVPKNKS